MRSEERDDMSQQEVAHIIKFQHCRGEESLTRFDLTEKEKGK